MIPVVQILNNQEGVEATVLACAEAVVKFTEAKVSFNHADHETFDASGVFRSGELPVPDVMLLATAWGPSLDKILLKAAGPSMIPSVSVIDMWSCYMERYLDPDSGELVLPSRIAIMDQAGANQAVTAGIPEALLVITGQPHIEDLVKPGQANNLDEAQTLRESWLDGETDPDRTKVVLFASEAIARDFGPGSGYDRGYTEKDALQGVLDAARSAGEKTGFQIKVIVRPHPEQGADDFSGLIESEFVMKCGSAEDSILASNLIVGMTSMFLIEASAAGKATISFQPGSVETLPFIGVTNGMVEPASTVDGLSDLMVRSINGDGLRTAGAAEFSSHEGAAARIVDLTLAVARRYEASKRGETL